MLSLGWFFQQQAANTLPPALPPHPMPAVNARDYYISAANTLVDSHKIDEMTARKPAHAKLPNKLSPPPRATTGGFPGDGPPLRDHVYLPSEKAELVQENTQAMQLLRQGFPFPYQEPPGSRFSTTYPYYQNFRRLSRLLRLQAQIESERRQWNSSLSACLDAIQLGETLPHGGPLIGMLVGAASQSDGRKYAWVAADHLTAAEARAAARRLEAIRMAHVPFADTLREEKWSMQAGLRDDMAKPDWAVQLLIEISGESPRLKDYPQGWIVRKASVFSLESLGKRKILLNNARWMDQAIVQAQQPYAAHLAPPPLPSDSINSELLFDYRGARFREIESDIQNALLVTALALQAYHQDHKAYPATLATLVPSYLKAVPTDPFAPSGPLHYKLTGAKYVLYSVGPDGKDDGGQAIFDATQPAPSSGDTSDRRRWTLDDSTGDVVAGVNVI